MEKPDEVQAGIKPIVSNLYPTGAEGPGWTTELGQYAAAHWRGLKYAPSSITSVME